MNRLKANWELFFFNLQNAEVEREKKEKAVLVHKWVTLQILQSVSSHGFSTEIKFPVLAVYYFSLYRESVTALLLWGFISTTNLDYPSIE